jgi:hypothetical protein
MTLSKLLPLGALTLLLGAPVQAMDVQAVLSGGFLLNQGSTVDLTQKRTGGYTVEAGVLFAPPDFGPRIQAYVGLSRIPAAEPAPGGSTFTMDGPRFGADLVYQPWESLPITLRVGPSFHIWQVQAKDHSALSSQGDQGIKLGWRTGVGYDLSKNWSVSLYYTATEWRSDPNQGLESDNPSRPAYFSLMGSYRF